MKNVMKKEALDERRQKDIDSTIRESPILMQGRFWCVLCDTTITRIGWAIIKIGWPSCCDKKMDIVPTIDNEFKLTNRPRLYIRSLSRS